MEINNTCKVEILLATYNGEKYVKEQLDSILNQSYQNFVITIRDDNSKDNTLNILKEYKEKYPDKINLIVDNEATGSAKNNFFKLMSISTENYMMCCDQDDIWEAHKVEVSVNKIIQIEKKTSKKMPILVFTDLMVVDSEMNVLAPSFEELSKLDCKRTGLNNLLMQNVITGCTMIFNRALCEKALKVKNTESVTMHDAWLGLVAAAFGKIEYMPIQTIRYRQHGDNSVGAKSVLSPKYIFNKIFVNNDIKLSMLKMINQGSEFYSSYKNEFSIEQKDILEAFTSLNTVSKMQRLSIYKKYDFYKNGLFRKVAQSIWG